MIMKKVYSEINMLCSLRSSTIILTIASGTGLSIGGWKIKNKR